MIISFGDQHRTSSYVRNWKSNRRLKRESPLIRAESEVWLLEYVEYVSLTCHSVIDAPLCDRVFFRTDLCFFNKSTQHPDYLKQLALEIIQEISKKCYTDLYRWQQGQWSYLG